MQKEQLFQDFFSTQGFLWLFDLTPCLGHHGAQNMICFGLSRNATTTKAEKNRIQRMDLWKNMGFSAYPNQPMDLCPAICFQCSQSRTRWFWLVSPGFLVTSVTQQKKY